MRLGRFFASVVLIAAPGCRQLLGIEEPAVVDASSDVSPDTAGPVCLGRTGWRVCLTAPPPEIVVLPGMIDTGASAVCDDNVRWEAGQDQPAACFIAAGTMTVAFTRAVGARPLVLVASESIVVTGALDVSSRRLPSEGVADLGAGANDVACAAANVGASAVTPTDGGGGGAGGSHDYAGGKGGSGAGIRLGGAPVPAEIRVALRGGCPGGVGGAHLDNSVGGGPGAGGGAVYLVAPEIDLADKARINASGSRGAGGDRAAGGGGGGSGGMIVLSTPNLTAIPGAVMMAMGGGGASGGDSTTGGVSGGEPMDPDAGPAPGGMGSSGGAGGRGCTLGAGEDGNASPVGTAGGGGGGGGCGAILFDALNATVAAAPRVRTL